MPALLQPALVAVALAAADPRAYSGPEAVREASAEPDEAGAWPASAGSPPGSRDMSQEPAAPAEPAAPGAVPAGAVPTSAAPSEPAPIVPGAVAPGLEREVRYIEVSTDMLGRSTRLDVMRHAGGRTIVDVKKAMAQGAGSVAELLDRVPGVRAVEGGSGLGTSSTKLNVAVRGANPRLSEQATVMLDEVPIAPAPYGNPSLSLFPLSLFQIAKIDAVRGGTSVRFGPWTSGGVFNLVSHPIPENPTIAVTGQVDQFGDAGLAGSYGGTHRKLGMYFEYAPRFGKTYREHSEFQSHGGIIKLTYPITSRLRIDSSTHLFWEKSGLPGGLAGSAYAEDRFQSVRPNDRFDGHREATSLKLRWRPREHHEMQVIGFYSHTFRRSVMATNDDRNVGAAPMYLSVQPRLFNVFGVEPRYALRVRHKHMFQDLTFGVRGVFEWARLRETYSADASRPASYLGDSRSCETGVDVAYNRQGRRCLDGRTLGFSLYAEDKLYLLDTRLVLTAGIRGEIMQQGFYNVLERRSVPRPLQGGALPGLSLWYGVDEVAGFIGYGRSFGAPSYFSASVTTVTNNESRYVQPEVADMAEAGVKMMELGGVYADLSGWYKYFRFLRDEGDNSISVIDGAHAYGAEINVEWLPGEVWERIEGLELQAGYAYTGSAVREDLYTGNRMPWYPAHEAWGSASYRFPFGLKFGSTLDYTGKQFTDYANTVYRATEEIGVMPAYTLMTANVGLQTALPRDWRIEVTVGVKNLLNTMWFTRTDDLNGGKLAMRPRTFYLNLGIAHEFIRGRQAEQARSRGVPAPDRRRWTATDRRNRRQMQRILGAWM